jgi:hypothetical protein
MTLTLQLMLLRRNDNGDEQCLVASKAVLVSFVPVCPNIFSLVSSCCEVEVAFGHCRMTFEDGPVKVLFGTRVLRISSPGIVFRIGAANLFLRSHLFSIG